jgi:hypothetical protein
MMKAVLRIRDVYLGSRILIFTIPDPGSKNSYKREGRKKLVVIHFIVATNLTKCKIIFFLNCWRKKFGPNFTKLSKIWVWDPGSEIGDLELTYSWSRIQGSKRHQIPDPGPGSATLDESIGDKADNKSPTWGGCFFMIKVPRSLRRLVMPICPVNKSNLCSCSSVSRMLSRSLMPTSS